MRDFLCWRGVGDGEIKGCAELCGDSVQEMRGDLGVGDH